MDLQNTYVAIALHLVCHLSFNLTDPRDGDDFGDLDLNLLNDLFNILKESFIGRRYTDRNNDSEKSNMVQCWHHVNLIRNSKT